MSIKYLGDNQLNQIQNDPNDTPWAKLIAQSEILERNKMRQPQGRFPQGTVAGNIQQQLINDQMQQARQVQGLDADKARLLAQLIGSGRVPGMSDGGMPASLSATNPTVSAQRYIPGVKQAIQDYLSKESAPSIAYENVMKALSARGMAGGGLAPSLSNVQQAPALGVSPINPAKPQQVQQLGQPQLAADKDPNAQADKHDIFQRILDQSIIGAVQGKANLNDTLQLYADIGTGKFLKGLSEGGEVRRFGEGGTLFEQLQRIKSQLAGAGQGWTPEAAANYKSAYTPELVAEMRRRGLNPSGQPLNMSDIMNRPPVSAPSAPQTTAPQSAFRAEAPRLHIGSGLPPDLIAEMHAEMYPELVGPRRGAAMSSPEAQAYLRDPTSIKATPISEFVGPQAAPSSPSVKIGGDVLRSAGSAINLAMLPSTIDAMTDPDKKSQEEIKAAWEKGGVPEVFRYENAKAANNLSRAGDWITENVGHPLHKLWYGPNAVIGATEQPAASTNQPAAPTEQPATPTAAPASQPTAAPTTQVKTVVKQPATQDNAKQIAQAHGYEKQNSVLLDKAQQAAALDQTEQALTKTGADSVTDMLYKRLKDADVDYSELAKRISENEKDLARERKDSDLVSGLLGLSSALTEAGNYKQVGDRVFKPSIASIIGTGVSSGLGASKALEKEYQVGVGKNLEALQALQSLKRATSNDLMDAYAAERQNATLAQHYSNLDVNEAQKLPAEIAKLNAETGMYKERAGAYNRAGTEGAGSSLAGERLLTTQYNSLISKAQKSLDALVKQGKMEGDPAYDNVAKQIALYQSKLAELTPAGNAVNVAQPTTAEDFTGFIKRSSRPAK